MITVENILGVTGLLFMTGCMVFLVYAFVQFVIASVQFEKACLAHKVAERRETDNEAAARRDRLATLNVFGRMGRTEQQAFRQRGGVLPGEPDWLDPGSPEWQASFAPGETVDSSDT